MSGVSEQKTFGSSMERPRSELELREQFTAVVAHEMRNLLAPVCSAVALLARDDSPATVQVRQSIAKQVAQMKRLVDDLLDVARGEQGQICLQRARVDLREVIAEALDVARPAIVAGGHSLTVESDSSVPALAHGDRCRLVQVVSNLLLNAAKFTPEGGQINVLLQHGAGCTTTCIRDTGIGIDAEALPKIFDIYERAGKQHSAYSGVGIGMAVARYLVEAHGGTLRAYSAGAGKGSEFVMRLPDDESSDLEPRGEHRRGT